MIGKGLDNLGNTCYMNAVFQVVLHFDPLMETIPMSKHKCHGAVPEQHASGESTVHLFSMIYIDRFHILAQVSLQCIIMIIIIMFQTPAWFAF